MCAGRGGSRPVILYPGLWDCSGEGDRLLDSSRVLSSFIHNAIIDTLDRGVASFSAAVRPHGDGLGDGGLVTAFPFSHWSCKPPVDIWLVVELDIWEILPYIPRPSGKWPPFPSCMSLAGRRG